MVKSGKSIVCDRGKTKSMQEGKDRLVFEKLMFRNDQPVRGDERIIFIAMMNIQNVDINNVNNV
jgi:hypothetical protein